MIGKSTELATSGKGYTIGLVCLGIIATIILNSYVFIVIALISACINKRRKKKYEVQPIKPSLAAGKFHKS